MTNVPKTPIQTFVFFDLEATGLTRPRITELCLLSVQREELFACSPRVVNKLTLCVDPQKAISPTASILSGLYNDSLESQTSFNKEIVEIITCFLSRLPQPVCLVAHYGNGFDYPLLNAELKRVKCELPLDVVCVDSLDAIRTIDTKALCEEERARIDIQNQNNTTPTRQGIKLNQNSRPTHSRASEHLTNIATVKQDTMSGKRKADADSIDHIRKRLFANVDTEVENSEKKPLAAGATVSKPKSDMLSREATNQQNTEEIKPGATVVPALCCLKQSTSHEGQKVGLSVEVSSMLDSQQSVTDDMLMEAVDFVEAKGNFLIGTSLTKCPASGGNGAGLTGTNFSASGIYDRCGTQTDCASSPGTSVTASRNDNLRSLMKDGTASFPESEKNNLDSLRKNDANFAGTSVSVSTNNEMCEVKSGEKAINSSPSAQQSDFKADIGKIVDQMQISVESSTQNIITPVSTGVSMCNDITPITSTPVTDQEQATTIILPRLSYKLEEVYYRTFGEKPPKSHNAEDDCVTLMKVCKKRCPQFIDWVDQHQTSLSSFSPMY